MNVLKQIKTIFIFENPTLKDKGSVKITRERSILLCCYCYYYNQRHLNIQIISAISM